MDEQLKRRLELIYQAMKDHLFEGMIPFWCRRAMDREYGGYMTNFDESGNPKDMPVKNTWSQARYCWFFSHLCRTFAPRDEWAGLARAGVDFLIQRCWDQDYGGWYCRLRRDGTVLLDKKIVYDQCFTIYALAEYYLAFDDKRALQYASDTFDLLQKYCADTLSGGYYEYLERDWRVSPPGAACGDMKSLDSHMHLMEAFTPLFQASGREIHRRKLLEILDLIVVHMIDPEFGCGWNQFNPQFRPTPVFRKPVTLYPHEENRDHPDQSLHYTSYGHNVELAWLMRRALKVAKEDTGKYRKILRGLFDHAVSFGVDGQYGGLYRFGLHSGEILVTEKEFWQHTETLTGFLDGYEEFEDARYIDAFINIWEFSDTYLINHDVGEWRHFLDRRGQVVNGNLGQPGKVAYHTGRAMIECTRRLERLLDLKPTGADSGSS